MQFQKLTPNLVVRDVAASMEFYKAVLGFKPAITVPEQPPYVFGSVTSGAVEISSTTTKPSPQSIPLSAPSRLAAASPCLSKCRESKKSWRRSRRAEPKSPCH